MSAARRVLVVDDDEGVRTAVTWALEADGFTVDSVDNGLAAHVLGYLGEVTKTEIDKHPELDYAQGDLVGKSGVVFPAIPSGTDEASTAFAAKGIDVASSFLVHVTDGTTFLFPITDHASQVTNLMTPAVDAVFTGKARADSLTAVNEQVNALFTG